MTLQNIKVSLRTDDLSNWVSADPILKNGELAVVNDISAGFVRFKAGNGLSTFQELPFINDIKVVTQMLEAGGIEAKYLQQGARANASPFGLAAGYCVSANASFSQSLGLNAETLQGDDYSFVWNGDDTATLGDFYQSNGKGSFSINPLSGLSGFYIGDQNLASLLSGKQDKLSDSQMSAVDSGIDSGKVQKYDAYESAIDEKITIDDRISGICEHSDLSIIKLSSGEYEQLVSDSQTLSNCLYVVQDDFLNAFNQQIKNLADATQSSDAVAFHQLTEVSDSIPLSVSQLSNDAGYTTNIGTITGITMNGASMGTSGNIDLGTVITSLSNYYTSAQTSSSSELSDAFENARGKAMFVEWED